jgi:hypothetical protein
VTFLRSEEIFGSGAELADVVQDARLSLYAAMSPLAA